jgi:hypothetical protein
VQKIAHRFRNTGVVVIRDLEAFVAQSDEELNATLLGPELVERLRTARRSPLQRTKKGLASASPSCGMS